MATRSSKTTSSKTTGTAAKAKTARTRKAPVSKTALTAAAQAAASATTKSAGAAAATPTPTVAAPQPVVSGPILRKRELIDQVVKKSGIKKKDAKPVVEAMLAVMGAALQDGRELNLQPMGKIKVNRERKRPEGKVLIARIRQAKDLPASDVPEPQAKDVVDDATQNDAGDRPKATAAE